MRKFIAIITALSLILGLCSCATKEWRTEPSAYIADGPVAVGGVKLTAEPDSLAVYKNIAFLLTEGVITRLDLLTGGSTVIVSGTDALALGCDCQNLIAASSSGFRVYDYDGAEVASAKFNAPLSPYCVGIGGGKVAVASDSSGSTKLYLYDLVSGSMRELSDRWAAGGRKPTVRQLGFTPDGLLLINFICNPNLAGYDPFAVRYDPESDVSVSTPLEAGELGGFIGSDGSYYCTENYSVSQDGELTQLICCISTDGSKSNILVVDSAALKKHGIEPMNYYRFTVNTPYGEQEEVIVLDSYSTVYADGESFTVYNSTALTLATVSDTSGERPVVLFCPESADAQGRLTNAVLKYTAKSGRQLLIQTCPDEEYADRLRTKLFAGDSDFDLFVADSELLLGILANLAYEPLDSYTDIRENFDSYMAEGLKELMSDGGSIYGVPLGLQNFNIMGIADPDVPIPEGWNFEDMFEICDALAESGKKLFRDSYVLNGVLCGYIDSMLAEDGGIQKEELRELLAKFKEYYDAGTLCGEPFVLTYAYISSEYLTLSINSYEATGYVMPPSQSGETYFSVNSALMLNRASSNKDAASEFAALLTSDYVYENRSFGLLVGREIHRNSNFSKLSDDKKAAAEFMNMCYKYSALSRTSGIEGFTYFTANDILPALFDGSLSPDEAVELITDRIDYRFFE